MKLLTRSPILTSFFATLVLLPGLGAIDYQQTIFPILNSKCHQCHSGPRAKGKLRMDTEEQFSRRIGGEHPVIVPGSPETSLLAIKAGLPRTDGDAMPPPPARARGAEPLTDVELNLVKQWIAAGAKFDSDDAPVPAVTAAGDTAPAAGEPSDSSEATAPAAMAAPRLLDWSNREGASLQAFFVSLSGDTVTLRRDDGSEFAYPLANLSDQSQAQARELAAGAQ